VQGAACLRQDEECKGRYVGEDGVDELRGQRQQTKWRLVRDGL